MPVAFLIPGPLRPFAGGRRQVVMEARFPTLESALQALWRECPALRDRVINEQGLIREHINVFVGPENVRYTGGLHTPLPEHAEISILPSITGGA